MAAGHFPERIVAQVQGSGRKTGPRNARIGQPLGKPGGLEGSSLEDPIIAIDLADQPLLDELPTLHQGGQSFSVQGNARVLDPGRGLHVPAPQQRPGDVQLGHHGGKEPGEGSHVRLAVIEEFPLFLLGPGAATLGQLPHGVFFRRLDAA